MTPSVSLASLFVRDEQDVVAVRQRARDLAARLGFDGQGQTRIATAVSEIARNAFMYAGGGKVEMFVEGRDAPQRLLVRVSDRGPGIRDLDTILAGRYRSSTGMGIGMLGARRLVDHFEVTNRPGVGVTVALGKLFPRRAAEVDPPQLAAIAAALARETPRNPLEEIRQQNQELLRTLDELRQRQEELSRLNAELQDTNRGVLALYAELDEKADTLRRADEMKSRFLSNMSHEFRTPLNSMLALSRLLLEDAERPLSLEQRRQVGYVRKAAEDLIELVNDLLDLAKVEAGKVVVRAVDFDVANLFATLRGMLRPLLLNESIEMVFDDPQDLPPMHTDEAKVSQILRNLLSNALKFTERGEIRVGARRIGDMAIEFSVADTGIGIAPEDQQRIFEEFDQIDNPMQRRVHGTGLGLPLVRRLTTLLGGRVTVESTLGIGSTFRVVIPIRCPHEVEPEQTKVALPGSTQVGALPVLVVEDSSQDSVPYDYYFRGSSFQVLPARTLAEARRLIDQRHPVALVLDIRLADEEAGAFVGELRRRGDTRDVPIVVVSSIDDQAKGLTLGADACAIKPVHPDWLLGTLRRLLDRQPGRRVLVIDDDEISRYLVRNRLAGAPFQIREAGGATQGLRDARAEHPDAIILDLVMPEMSGFDVLAQLKRDPATMDIPVVILTSKALSEEERRRLAPHALQVLSKQGLADGAAVAELRAALSNVTRREMDSG
ncbi:MAG TPA: ATP-binding protein [Methylomirabilota bacterium]|nr:ATP-binding protein [Methylomirabilota bacterium]